jgi:hypothetical protein
MAGYWRGRGRRGKTRARAAKGRKQVAQNGMRGKTLSAGFSCGHGRRKAASKPRKTECAAKSRNLPRARRGFRAGMDGERPQAGRAKRNARQHPFGRVFVLSAVSAQKSARAAQMKQGRTRRMAHIRPLEESCS